MFEIEQRIRKLTKFKTMRILKATLPMIVGFLILVTVYFTIGFIELEFNPLKWAIEARKASVPFIFFSMILGLAGTVFILMINDS